MHGVESRHHQPVGPEERRRAGREAQARYPEGCAPVAEHPVLFCRAADRSRLRDRLSRQPWKEWYDELHRPLAEVAMAAGSLADLRRKNFHLEVFPTRSVPVRPVQMLQDRWLWYSYIANCAFVGFLEDDQRFRFKARSLLLESLDLPWAAGGGWGGEDYDVGSGYDNFWQPAAMLVLAYDLAAAEFSPKERLRFEARLARDMEWCQTEPLSSRNNAFWFAAPFLTFSALLLGRADYVALVEGQLEEYVERVLYGEGEYYEGPLYQAAVMEHCNHQAAYAIWKATGRNPMGNPRWRQRAEHWVRRASPLGTEVTHSDTSLLLGLGCGLMAGLELLGGPVRNWIVWLYRRYGDPGWLNLRGTDAQRRAGAGWPFSEDPLGCQQTAERRRRHPWPQPETPANPAFWLMVPDPLPEPQEPPAGSYLARSSGLACLRSDWSMDSLYACLYAPRYYGNAHSHCDILTFDLWAHGAYLVKNPGYHEHCGCQPAPELLAVLGAEPPAQPSPPAPWTTWGGWDKRSCYRQSPEAHNIPTIDRGGGNHQQARAENLHFLTDTGWAQAACADGGESYARCERLSRPA